MRRSLRPVPASLVLVLAASLLAQPARGDASAATDPAPAPSPAGSGITVIDAPASSRSFVTLGGPAGPADASARATQWPIGGGRSGAMTATTVAAPTANAAQQITSARMSFFRTYGGYMEGVVDLAAAPNPADPATQSVIVMRWGNVSGSTCFSPENAGVSFLNVDEFPEDTNPSYSGTRITVTPAQLTSARTAAYNCAYVDSRANTPEATLLDDVIGNVALFRQKPKLSIQVKGRRLARGFVRVPVIIRNSRDTVATAPNVRLRIKARGLAVRFNPRVGTIKPGGVRRGAIQVKDTARGRGQLTLIVTSRDYTRKITVREVPA